MAYEKLSTVHDTLAEFTMSVSSLRHTLECTPLSPLKLTMATCLALVVEMQAKVMCLFWVEALRASR